MDTFVIKRANGEYLDEDVARGWQPKQQAATRYVGRERLKSGLERADKYFGCDFLDGRHPVRLKPRSTP